MLFLLLGGAIVAAVVVDYFLYQQSQEPRLEITVGSGGISIDGSG